MSTDNLINPLSFVVPATLTLADLLREGYLVIPDYQRDYSWTSEEVSALWYDLLATAKSAFATSGAAIASPRPHFIGAIVLQAFPPQEQRQPEVMDGQQRLVTLSALLSVLIEFTQNAITVDVRSLGDALKNLLTVATTSGTKLRITLSRDHEHYRELVCLTHVQAERDKYFQSLGQVSAKSVAARLKGAVDLFYEKVQSHLTDVPEGKARDERLRQLIRSVCELTLVLKMSVEEQGVAYEIFESLNARGLELQQADLLKNKLISVAEKQNAKKDVVAWWARMQLAIEKLSFLTLTEYLFFHFVASYDPTARQDALYSAVSAHLAKGTDALDFVEDAAKRAEELQQIYEAGPSYVAVERDVEAIRDTYRNKYASCLLIAACKRFGAASSETLNVIRLTHRFVFRRFIVEGVSAGGYAKEIALIARQLHSGHIKAPEDLASSLLMLSSDAVFVSKFEKFSAQNNKIGFYVIEAIENHLSQGQGITVQRQSYNQHLEHIMPQSLGNQWAHLADDPRHGDYVNRIGNLLVLERSINQSIKNKCIQTKLQGYAQSQMKLPGYVNAPNDAGGNATWSFESIDKRQQVLADLYAVAVWPLSVS